MTVCKDCNGLGNSEAFLAMQDHFRALLNDKRIQTSDDLARITEFLCGRSGRRIFGHDLGDVWTIIFDIGKDAGLKENWSLCKTCNGSGEAE